MRRAYYHENMTITTEIVRVGVLHMRKKLVYEGTGYEVTLQDITGLHLTLLIQRQKNVREEWQLIWQHIKSHDFVPSHVKQFLIEEICFIKNDHPNFHGFWHFSCCMAANS